MSLVLAWRPFLDPLPAQDWWWALLLPLTLGIAVAYKAVKVRDMRRFWRQALAMWAQVVLGMLAVAAALYVFVEKIVPIYW